MSAPAVLTELAQFLGGRRDGIVQQFAAAVRLDQNIKTAHDLLKEEIVDHLPDLFEKLAIDLQEPEDSPHLPETPQSTPVRTPAIGGSRATSSMNCCGNTR